MVQKNPDNQSQIDEKSNQQKTNSDLRNVSLQFDPIERNFLLARVDDQTQTFTTALINPGTAVAEVDGASTFSDTKQSNTENHKE